jgi:hypothetical protein
VLKSSFAMSCLAVAVLAGCGSDAGGRIVDSAAPDGAGGAGGNPADAPLALDAVATSDLPSGTGGTGGIDAHALVDASAGGAGGGGAGSGGSGGGDVSIAGGGGGGSGGAADGGGRDGGEVDRGQGGSATGGAQGGGPGSGGVGPGGAGGVSHGGADGGLDGGGPSGTGGATCGTLIVAAAHVPADVLLVLDRSASMGYSLADDCYCTPSSGTPACPDTASCTPRWTALVSALDATMTSAPAINWGLKLFTSPGGSVCSVSAAMEVPISPSSTSIIQSQIASVVPGNNTPTRAAITAATTYLKTVMDGNSKVILLATDGEPNCAAGGSSSSSDIPGTITAIGAARSAGFPVYVIGIGPSVGNLDNFAQAGGTSRYFPATSPETLTDALRAVSTATTTCAFTLPTPPPDPDNVGIYLDKKLVPRDSSDGWSFGPTAQTVVLAGLYCDQVTSGAASQVQALFTCPGATLPPVLP